MVGIPPTDSGHHGMPPVPQTTRENGLSTGQIGSLILEMNAILRNEFYPVLGSRLTHRFDTIWGTIQGLLCAEAISAAQNLAKTTRESPITTQQPPTARSYAAAARSNPTNLPNPQIQPVPRTLTREVRVSRRDCPDTTKSELQDPAKVVPLLNQAIAKFSNGQVEAARALPSGDLILRVDSAQTQQDLHRQNGWTEALGAGTRLNRPRFTVLVKSVRLDALDCSNQEVARGTLVHQNPHLGKVEIIHIGRERARQVGGPARSSTVLVDVASPQQANLLIQEGLVLGYIHHTVELFHRDCRVTRCYQCQSLGHMARVCRHKACCGWCASKEHSNDKECPRRAKDQPARCANCRGDHPAWAGQCPVRQEAATRAREAFLTRPTQFAEDHSFPPLSRQADEPRIAAKRKPHTSPEDDPPRARGRPRALDSAGRSQQGAIFSFVQQTPSSEDPANANAECEL